MAFHIYSTWLLSSPATAHQCLQLARSTAILAAISIVLSVLAGKSPAVWDDVAVSWKQKKNNKKKDKNNLKYIYCQLFLTQDEISRHLAWFTVFRSEQVKQQPIDTDILVY